MKGVCHIWSRGRHFSPSLPGDRYLNLGSPKKRSPGRNIGEHRSVRRSGTASRGTALLVFCLRMRRFLEKKFLPYSRGKNVHVNKYDPLSMKTTRTSSFNLWIRLSGIIRGKTENNPSTDWTVSSFLLSFLLGKIFTEAAQYSVALHSSVTQKRDKHARISQTKSLPREGPSFFGLSKWAVAKTLVLHVWILKLFPRLVSLQGYWA